MCVWISQTYMNVVNVVALLVIFVTFSLSAAEEWSYLKQEGTETTMGVSWISCRSSKLVRVFCYQKTQKYKLQCRGVSPLLGVISIVCRHFPNFLEVMTNEVRGCWVLSWSQHVFSSAAVVSGIAGQRLQSFKACLAVSSVMWQKAE